MHQAYDNLNMKCIFYACIPPPPLLCFLPFSSLHFSSLHWWMQTYLSVKSILIYPRLCLTLRFQVGFFSLPSFNFVSLYLRKALLQEPWFSVFRNAEEEASGKQYLHIFQAAVGDPWPCKTFWWFWTSNFLSSPNSHQLPTFYNIFWGKYWGQQRI